MIIAQVMQTLTIVCAAFLIASASTNPCPSACKCFTSDNGIQSANCTDLPDQMTTAWPQKNLRIHSESDHASPVMLKNRAFKHFPRLTYLDVTDVTIQYVGNLAFDGLPELLELNLVGTGIRKLHRNTFAGNWKLAFLSLKRNPRLSVGPSFLVSNSVTELDLSECGLASLKSVYFKGLTNLKYLFVAKNDLRVLGPQFGPPGLKYVNLAHNHIESIHEDLETYKRLRTIDLTGNPVNCTCELSELDRKLTARGVAFGNTITCKNTGKSLGDLMEVCADKEMMGDEPVDMFKADGLLKIDQKQWQSMAENDYLGSGSGSGDYEPVSSTSPDPLETTVATVASTSENNTPQAGVFEPTSSVRPSSSEDPADVVGIDVEKASEENTAGEKTTATEEVFVVHVEPTVQTSDGGNSTSTARAGMDGGIVPLTIQAPEDGDHVDGDDVQTKVAEYLKTNVGITGTAVVLAVVIVAIVYKAVCMGKKMSRDDAVANEKSVELKEIKYMAADTEDSHDHRHIDSPSDGSVEENHLLEGDRDSDDDDGDGGDAGEHHGSPPVNVASNGDARNGDLLNSVMDAVKSTSSNGQPANGRDVPTRVVVKMGETPKTSKPVAINNVQ